MELKKPQKGHVIFAYSKNIVYPAIEWNVKISYVSKELMRRGFKVTWAQIDGGPKRWKEEGLEFVKLGRNGGPKHEVVGNWLNLMRLLKFCRESDADCLYYDDWTFLRERPLERLFLHIGLKTLGIRVVTDQRDPRIDFEVASGELREGSLQHKTLALQYRLMSKYTDLSIFPSEVYEEEMRKRGLASRNSLGTIRGIDVDKFRDIGAGDEVRANLGIQDKFVVGWFGRMNRYRRIEEVLVPLMENAVRYIPNVYFIIGGQGELQNRFDILLKKNPGAKVHLAGPIPYDQLPKFIAACDVLLCPLDINHGFTSNSSPLKILEALALGRPVVATSIKVQKRDYGDLTGVVWTGMEYDDFIDALVKVHREYSNYRKEAKEQASNFTRYSIAFNIGKIVSRMEQLL